ncbi:MAG TPA: GTP 3',8-cyclase MoaA [Solirubrobacteraceae bacterium]|jgi:cyclic pyranopterin phosphate synthase|nr:GTP 3',8-cyclase MoaA [Solirubrobacteraceae bacterium]
MLDRLNRPLRDLRISVTDRCNLRCPYCMPREVFGPGFAFLPREELLSFEEITRLAAVFARLGVAKVRLTGGEPLLRRDLDRLVRMLAATEGLEEIAMTTNGVLLAAHAERLAKAGLQRVTVSLDALDPDVVARMSDAPVSSERVLAGIEAAVAAGLAPVKVNMVVRRGVNDGCLIEMAERFRGRDVVLRFIEYMDVGGSNRWRREHVVPAAEVLATLAERWPLQPLEPVARGEVATRYRYLDGAGEIGVIHSVSKPFCADCVRARLSADGQLFTCLFASSGADLRAPLRAGADAVELERCVRAVWEGRSDRYSAERSAASRRPQRPRVEMSYIGG